LYARIGARVFIRLMYVAMLIDLNKHGQNEFAT
jgi:hypothetical protein